MTNATATDVDPRLVQRAHEAFAGLPSEPGRSEWPPAPADVFAGVDGIPEIDASELDATKVASGVTHHGALLVRNLVDQAWVAQLKLDIDRAIEGHDAWKDGAPVEETAPWFVPFEPPEEHAKVRSLRRWVREGGGCWASDSPQAFADLRAAYDQVGLRSIIAEHLGEQPTVSVNKATLRRVSHDLPQADWHQDGAFLERAVGLRTVNVWLTLTDCGVAAPGLDVLPVRMRELAERGTNGAFFDWSVGNATVEALATETPVVRPVFRAGDALLFDEMNLHRTALSPDMIEDRYAIECWFFAASTFPPHHVPVVF